MGVDVRLESGSVFAQDFRVVRPLDEGGMGLVYLVEQLSTGEERALKVLKPRLLADARSRDRFNQEATVGANIHSDHVVKVISAGVDDTTGVPWIAMELLRGDNLAQVVRDRGSLAPAEVLDIASQLCHALGAAHKAGVVHRDLKPENIFLCRTQRAGARFTVKLLDFGIAKVMQEFETSLTATTVVGSPLWMAPEQVRRGRIRAATDVWALGLIVFYALTGCYYWRSAAGDSHAPAEALLHEKLFEPLEPATVRAAEFAPEVVLPRGFDAWFKRCVARDPDDRFRDANEAFTALDAVLAREYANLRPRVRWGLVTGGAMAVALAGALVVRAGGLGAAVRALVPGNGGATIASGTRGGSERGAQAQGASERTGPAPNTASALPPLVALTRIATVAPAAPSEGAVGAARANRAGEPGGTAPHALATHPQPASPPVPHTVPQGEGYTFRVRTENNRRCPRDAPRAWQATPDWYTQRADEFDQRERNVRAEERRATRASSMGERAEIEAQAARDRERLERDRAAWMQQLPTQISGARLMEHTLATRAGCRDQGLIQSDDGVYAIWCCP